MTVVVIGAGVVGLACAYELAQDGHEVELVEAGKPGAAASHGNAAKIALAESTPVPSPGMVLQGLKWMLRPDSPLYVKPTLAPPALQFMLRMARNCTEAAFRSGLEVHLRLANESVDIFDEWARSGLDFEMHRRGVLLAFETTKAFEHRRTYDDVFDKHGVHAKPLDSDGVHTLEPSLSDRIKHGVFYEGDRQIEPDSLTASLAKRCRALGVRIHESTSVTAFERSATAVTAVRTDVDRLRADKVVLAAGVWSGPLSQTLGSSLPIRPGKGYSVDFTPAPVNLGTSLTFQESHVAVTPLNGMIRVAGTMEFGGFDSKLNRRRIEAIMRACEKGFEQWNPEAVHKEPWAGLRPMTPDGLPIIGALREVPNVVVASGHGMLGLTLAPATARCVRALVSGSGSNLDLRAVSPDRFARPTRRSTGAATV